MQETNPMNVGDSKRALPKLGDTGCTALEFAVAQMVRSKHACDALTTHDKRLATIAGYGMDLWPDGYRTEEGVSFYLRAFPFAQMDCAERGVPALAPTQRTIGDAHRGYDDTLSPEELKTRLAFLQSPDRAVRGRKECATYTWIRPLGLFLAGEGKNRVSLFQRLGIDWIPACVSAQDYPSSERIVLYMIEDQGLTQCWAVLDARWAEYLANPMWALPVLRAYGVKVEQRWPCGFPPLAAVRRAHGELSEERSRTTRRVDLEIVSARENWENDQEQVSPLFLIPLERFWKGLAVCGLAAAAAVLLLGVAPAQCSSARLVGAGLLGAVVGTLIMAEARLIPMSRRHTRAALGYRNWERSPPRQRPPHHDASR